MSVCRTLARIAGYSAFAVVVSTVSRSHSPEVSAGRAAAQVSAHPEPTNLKVLPQDISAAELKKLMERYGQELGVSCEYCHAENPQTQQPDYASDDNPAKQTARIMIAMLRDINTKYLAQLGDERYAVHVTCGNCHQGETDPPVFEPKLRP